MVRLGKNVNFLRFFKHYYQLRCNFLCNRLVSLNIKYFTSFFVTHVLMLLNSTIFFLMWRILSTILCIQWFNILFVFFTKGIGAYLEELTYAPFGPEIVSTAHLNI
jgi:hypothetical protein